MNSLCGKYLIASPKMTDPNFFHSVLLMVQHTEEGAMGLVLNRPTDKKLSDVWDQVSDGFCSSDGPLYHGGPCEGPLMILHTDAASSQIDIGNGLYLSAEQEHVRWLIEGGDVPAKAFIGYAGWAAGQLESEIQVGSWLTLPADTEEVVDTEPDWDRLIQSIAPSMIEVKIVPKDPRLN